ncbi:MAG: ankyrin repeat domain-containing protein [Gammaproteobacteria bacterium]|nr:ankyrin repeat domain-containing protein [Gammaproteobacteria bacterium]
MLYKNIEADKVQDLIAEGPISILDMRDLNSFNSDHMPDAKPANDFVIEQLVKRNNKSENILIYCYLGNSSRDLSNLLSKFGFQNVYNLVGGFTAWKKYTLSKASPENADPTTSWLINKGFDPSNIRDRVANGNTALMEAAIEGNVDMVNTLISRGADADLVNKDENLALWFACFSDNIEVVKTLIFSTSNLNHQNVNGATCLSYAASSGKFDVVKTLVEAGADPEIATHDGFSATELASTAPILKFLRSLNRPTLVSS